MAQKTPAQIQAQSNSTFVDNTEGLIIPSAHRTFNDDFVDSVQFLETGVTKAALETVRAASGLRANQWYIITNGTASNNKVIAIKASTTSAFYTNALNLTDGSFGTYSGPSGDVYVAVVRSGTWVPTISTFGGDAGSDIKSTYNVVDGYVNFQCRFELTNSGMDASGTITLTTPTGLNMSTASQLDCSGCFSQRFAAAGVVAGIIESDGAGLIQFVIDGVETPGPLEFTIVGSYKLA